MKNNENNRTNTNNIDIEKIINLENNPGTSSIFTTKENIFFHKEANNSKFIEFAYQQQDEEMEKLKSTLPENYELLLMTDHLNDTNKSADLRTVVFINRENKEVVFATAGTRPGLDRKGLNDFYDDAMLALFKSPRKLTPAKILSNMVLDSLGEETKNYKFHFTGHSLGAAMSEIMSANMDIKLKNKYGNEYNSSEQIECICFECPGTKKILEKMYEENGLPKNSYKQLNLTEYNNRDNVINSVLPRAGKEIKISPDKQQERVFGFVKDSAEYCANICSKWKKSCGKILGHLFDFLESGFNAIKNGKYDLISLVSDHSLQNFTDVFVNGKGTFVNENNKVIRPKSEKEAEKIKLDEQVFETIKNLQKDKGNISLKREYYMSKYNDEKNITEIISFNKFELDKACKENNKKFNIATSEIVKNNKDQTLLR
ncbi:MAG TPA: hypothetical protein QKA14_01355 [Candidatus Megaira endosymbiont of Hartmannula sinica]|nr:hypothetical protein [Candidatus Megaera endosymbiont of Hartmannula sinica]